MNSYERYMGMINGRKIDCVPRIPILMHYAADFINASYADFAENYNVLVDANLKLVEKFQFDQLDIMSDPYRETTAYGGEIEYHPNTVPRCTKIPLEKDKNLDVLLRPDVRSSERLVNAIKAIEKFRELAWKKYSITGWVEGPAAEAADLRTAENFLMDLIDDPKYCVELMNICVDYAIDFADAQINSGSDTIGVGDAIASQVSTKIYEELILPIEKRLVDGIHKSGGLVRLHICGDINRLLPGISRLGVDIIDCDHMVDMKLARKILGDKCVLAGNLDPVEGVLNGTPESIRSYFMDLYKELGNPFFINAGCEIPRGTPEENILALCKPIEIIP